MKTVIKLYFSQKVNYSSQRSTGYVEYCLTVLPKFFGSISGIGHLYISHIRVLLKVRESVQNIDFSNEIAKNVPLDPEIAVSTLPKVIHSTSKKVIL